MWVPDVNYTNIVEARIKENQEAKKELGHAIMWLFKLGISYGIGCIIATTLKHFFGKPFEPDNYGWPIVMFSICLFMFLLRKRN